MKVFLTVFITVFLAELGDKTQLATLLFASDKDINKLTVFFGAAMALVATSAIGVLGGDLLSNYINPKYLNYAAGIGFIVIGLIVIIKSN